jgi:hypothetical protein
MATATLKREMGDRKNSQHVRDMVWQELVKRKALPALTQARVTSK